jgi:hypothetical protein
MSTIRRMVSMLIVFPRQRSVKPHPFGGSGRNGGAGVELPTVGPDVEARMKWTRQPLRCSVAALALAAAVTAVVIPAAAASDPAANLRPAILDVTGWQHRAAAPALPTPSAGDGVGPGSYLLISRTDGDFICTANFLWNGGGQTYLGAAGHCFLPEGAVAVTGTTNPYVQKVQVCVSGCMFGGQLGAVFNGDLRDLGAVRYARQSDGAGNDVGHDFGLVAVPAALNGVLRRTVPVWGGPSGAAALQTGSPVCVYGNGVVVGEVFATRARALVGVTEDDGAWFADGPSAPGDSGSGVVNCAAGAGGLQGTTALGALTHLVVGAGAVAGTTVARAQQMVQQDTGISITLA